MKPTVFLAPLLLATYALAQATLPEPLPPFSRFPEELKAYLSLTDTQVESINRLNNDYLRFSAEKVRRVVEVQADIAEKTNAETLDPLELGVRYAELEAIRRDLRDKQNQLVTDVRRVLTEPQIARLRALEDAARLVPLITQAQCESLLPQPQAYLVPFGPQPPVTTLTPGENQGVSSLLPVLRAAGCRLAFVRTN
jgi:hypothetical protein